MSANNPLQSLYFNESRHGNCDGCFNARPCLGQYSGQRHSTLQIHWRVKEYGADHGRNPSTVRLVEVHSTNTQQRCCSPAQGFAARTAQQPYNVHSVTICMRMASRGLNYAELNLVPCRRQCAKTPVTPYIQRRLQTISPPLSHYNT